MATTAASGPPTTRVDVPSWNGEADKLTSYRFEVSMFTKSIKTAERYVCGPQLVRALGARVRTTVESCPDIDTVDEIDKDGVLIGWNKVFQYVLEKLDFTSLNDTGLLAEEFFLKVSRNSGETFQDWTARFEKKERELLAQLQVIDSSVTEVIAKPLRTWWFLRKSKLSPVQRGEITATAGGDLNFGKTYKALLTRFPAEALAELDGKQHRKAFYEDTHVDDVEDETGGEDIDYTEVVEQLITLAEEDEDEEPADDNPADNEVFAEFKQVGRSFKDARDLIRRLRVSRDYYPVVSLKDPDRVAPPPNSGRGFQRGRGKNGRGRARFDTGKGRDMSKMKCIACGEYGHRAADCNERFKKDNTRDGARGTTHNGFVLSALDEYLYLLERDGIWAILDIGATKSLGGLESVENLMYEMLDQHGQEFETTQDECSFTFGDGLQKSSMGTAKGNVFLGGHLTEVKLSVMPNRVPILLGMDILTDSLKVVVDCGRNWIGLPTMGNKVFFCERLSSNHLAVNLTTPQWWKEVPLSLPSAGCLTSEATAPDVLVEELPEEAAPDGNLGGADTYQSDGNCDTERIGSSDGNLDFVRTDGQGIDNFGSSDPDASISNNTSYSGSTSEVVQHRREGRLLRSSGEDQTQVQLLRGQEPPVPQDPTAGSTRDTRSGINNDSQQRPTEPSGGSASDETSEARVLLLRDPREEDSGVQLPRRQEPHVYEGDGGDHPGAGSGSTLAAPVLQAELPGGAGGLEVHSGNARRLGTAGDGLEEETLKHLDDQDLKMFYESHDKVLDEIYQTIAEDLTELGRPYRIDLMEVCCPEDSSLSKAVQNQGGKVFRCGLFNGIDMGTATGLRRALHLLRRLRPRRLVLSPPCTADCPIQNLNQKTAQQKATYLAKVRKARRIQRNCKSLWEDSKKIHDCHTELEQPAASRSWTRSPSIKAMRDQMHEGDNHTHRPIEDGQVVAQTAFYPPALCKAWAKHILKTNTSARYGKEIFTSLEQIPEDAEEEMEETLDEDLLQDNPEAMDDESVMKGLGISETPTKKEELEIEQRLTRLHRNLGHPSNKTLYKILKASGAPLQALRAALRLQCHACHAGQLPKAARVASGIELPGALEALASDGLEWLSPKQDSFLMTLNIDEGSGLTSVTYHGQKGERNGNRSTQEVISTWNDWCGHYRRPSLLRLDPEGCHRSQAVARWCSDRGIELWIAPGEAHWLMGKVERRIQLFKRLMTKLATLDPDCPVEELVSWAVSAINTMDKVGNHSPFEHVMGVSGMPASSNPFAIIDGDTGETQEQRRLLARKSFLEVEYAERRRHAEQARNRIYQTWNPGDLVYFWRKGKGLDPRPGKKGGWHGPARVLAQEKRHVDGRTRPTSVIWISHGSVLIRCAPEQLRVASEAEKMIVELQRQSNLGKTMAEILETAKGGTYEDLLGQNPPDLREYEHPPQPTMAIPATEGQTLENNSEAGESRPRWRMSHRGPELDLYVPPEKRQKGADEEMADALFDSNHLVDLFKDKLDITLGTDEQQTVYFEYLQDENPTPDGRRGLMNHILDSFVVNQRRKDKVELTWSKMNATEREEFEAAIAKETNNWVQHQGLRAVPTSRVKDAADVIRARWLFTRKSDGKAKARLVLLGYQTKDLGQEPTASPTASRRARHVMLTVAAANRWKLIKGDVTSAFLQAHDLDKDLFIEPDAVLRKAFHVQEGEILQVVKPGYGIGEAPRHWWETVKHDFAKLRLQACELEPCLWKARCSRTGMLIGMTMAHVDDFIMAGDTSHPEWQDMVKQIRGLYKWGTWEDMNDGLTSLEQRGVTIEESEQGFFLHQKSYIDKIKEVKAASGSKHRTTDSLKDSDKTVLRAFCGEIYWLGVNTMPFLLLWVADLQMKIPAGTHNLFTAANNIVKLVKQSRHMGIRIYRHALDDLAIFTWCDAAWASRPDGHSQGGHITAISSKAAMDGKLSEFTVLDWGSKKLRRVARSSLAAEVQEAGDAEGEQSM
ncbi:unnamed protein product, partial [Prorocentrum cordatum]